MRLVCVCIFLLRYNYNKYNISEMITDSFTQCYTSSYKFHNAADVNNNVDALKALRGVLQRLIKYYVATMFPPPHSSPYLLQLPSNFLTHHNPIHLC